MPRAVSKTLVRSVSSPPDRSISAFWLGWPSASGVAQNRVPISAAPAPSISAAASPLPSAMPPAAATGTGDTASTTAGTSGRVARSAPCPPASVPWATTIWAPFAAASRASFSVWTWQIRTAPAVADLRREGRDVAEGQHDRARLSFQRDVERGGPLVQRPGDEADTDRAVAGLFELALDPVIGAPADRGIGIPGADQPQTARSGDRTGQRAARHPAHRGEQAWDGRCPAIG